MIRYKMRSLFMALGLLGLSQLAKAQTSDTLRIALAEAIERTEQANLKVRSARLGADKAEIDKRVSRAKLFPTVALAGQYGYALKKQLVYFGSEDGSSNNPMAAMMPTEGIEMGQTHSIVGGITASMPLVAPQLWASLELDKLSVESALEKVRASRVSLRSEVRKAYLGALLAEESLSVLRASLANMQSNTENIKQKFDRGLVAEYDLVRMQTQENNLRPSILQAEQQARLAKMKLLILMNEEPDRPLVLDDSLSNYESEIETLLARYGDKIDLHENTTLKTLDLSQRQLATSLKIKRMEFMPTLALNFNYNYNFASDYLRLGNSRRWSPMSTIGLALNVPLYSGGSTKNGIKSIKLQQEQLSLEREEAERQLRLASRSQQDVLLQSREQYGASLVAEQSSRKGLEIATLRYRTGAGTLLELNDAELALRQAQLNKVQAVYNYMLSIYALDELQGK